MNSASANKLGYAIRVSHGVIARKDQSLKGVAVIIADHDHTNSEIQREISQFVGWPKPGNKFKILTEVDSDMPQWARSLCSKNFNRLDCIPVDLPGQRRIETLALVDAAMGSLLKALAVDGVELAEKMLAHRAINVPQNQQHFMDIWQKVDPDVLGQAPG